jgi:hypothetical protein
VTTERTWVRRAPAQAKCTGIETIRFLGRHGIVGRLRPRDGEVRHLSSGGVARPAGAVMVQLQLRTSSTVDGAVGRLMQGLEGRAEITCEPDPFTRDLALEERRLSSLSRASSIGSMSLILGVWIQVRISQPPAPALAAAACQAHRRPVELPLSGMATRSLPLGGRRGPSRTLWSARRQLLWDALPP